MNNITASSTIIKLREVFSRFGLPTCIVSDNGKTFMSAEFQTFLRQNGIKHVTSPAYYPSSNGAAENSVKTVKQFLLKHLHGSFDFVKHLNMQKNVTESALNTFLMMYRNTEHCSTGETPARLMIGRPLKTRLDLIKPNKLTTRETMSVVDVKRKLEVVQKKQKDFRKGRKRRNFVIGQKVLVKDFRFSKPQWSTGIIHKILGQRVVLIRIPNTRLIWKRHVDQLLPFVVRDVNIPDSCQSYDNEGNGEIVTSDSDSEYGSAGDTENQVSEGRVANHDGDVLNVVDDNGVVLGDTQNSVNANEVDKETLEPCVALEKPKRMRKPPDRFVV